MVLRHRSLQKRARSDANAGGFTTSTAFSTGLNMPARLQQMLSVAGASAREALWAVQLMERKAAVARWRSGEFGHDRGVRRTRARHA